MEKMSKQREQVLAIQIDGGLIQLIDPDDGCIQFYTQRGVHSLTTEEQLACIQTGVLNPYAIKYPELPKHWSIYFEDEEIMGKAYATFNPNRKQK